MYNIEFICGVKMKYDFITSYSMLKSAFYQQMCYKYTSTEYFEKNIQDELKKMMSIELLEITTDEIETPNVLRVQLSISMCSAFIKRSKALIGAGRLPCPFCGMPIDPQGHLCPRANGYRR